jgi:hypothetical protein
MRSMNAAILPFAPQVVHHKTSPAKKEKDAPRSKTPPRGEMITRRKRHGAQAAARSSPYHGAVESKADVPAPGSIRWI